MIPPLMKRARILVSGGVVIVISVKLYEIKSRLWLRDPAGKLSDILRPEGKSGLVRSQ